MKKLIPSLIPCALALVLAFSLLGCSTPDRFANQTPDAVEKSLDEFWQAKKRLKDMSTPDLSNPKAPEEQQALHQKFDEERKKASYICPLNDIPAKYADVPPIDLMLFDADLREALNELSMLTGVSIISDFTVEGYVSLNLTGATLQDALETILAVGNYGYRLFDNHILVGGQGPEDPSFHLLSSTCSYRPIYTTPTQLLELLPPYYQQFVSYNDTAASLSVVAPQSIQKRLKHDIQMLDRRPQQVLLELTIVEVSKSDLERLGIDWNYAKDYYANYQDARSGSPFYASSNSYVLPRPAQRAFLNAIQMMATKGKAHIKAMPSIVTLDGKQANFQSIQTQWFTDVVAATNDKTREINYGVQMTIVPHIADQNAVQLDILKASVSDLTTSHTGRPLMIGHSISSSVRVAAGNTLVVGGLLQSKFKQKTRAVPGLSSVPLVGGLFEQEDSITEQTEMLIVIRPMVMLV